MAYAVVRSGGKQIRVSSGDVVRVERLKGEVGDSVDLNEVLLFVDEGDVQVGRPLLAGAHVRAEIVEQARGRKLIIFKYKRRKRYRRKSGHRQSFTALRIGDVVAPNGG